MRARTKLNQAYFNGSLVIATLVGLVSRSWPLFFLVLAVLLASNLVFAQIRPKRHPRCQDKN